MVNLDAVWDALRMIDDPEMPINIVDLGIVDGVRADGEQIEIDLLPTFVGCPALHVIEDDIRRQVGTLAGVAGVAVNVRYSPPWTAERISAAGRESLRQFGVTVPGAEAPACPFCGSANVRLDSPFGPTRCRTIWYCEACRNPFEQVKKLDHAAPLLNLGVPSQPQGTSTTSSA